VHRVRLALAVVLAAALFSFPLSSSVRAGDSAALAAEWQVAWALYHFGELLPLEPLQRRVTRTLSIDIDAPLDRVFEAYSELDNHIGRHPFNRGQHTHEEREADGVHVRNFTTIEEIPVLFFSITIHTHAQQRVHAAEHFYTVDSWSAPDVVVHQKTSFADLGGGRTRVTEEVSFQTNAALIGFTVDNGTSSHEEGMRALKRDIQSGAI
jgi:hypothetical protein